MGQLTRRDFVQDALLAAAAACGPALPAPKPGPFRRSPNESVRVAVIGVKGQGHVHVGKWADMKDIEVAAVCDIDETVAGTAAATAERKSGKKPEIFRDMRKLLEDKSIDAVSIATPNHWHVLASYWAVQAGKDVYVEKPLGHNVWEQRRLVEAAHQKGRVVQMGNYTRSLESFRKAIAFLREGKLGRITLAQGLCYNKRGSIGRKPDGPVPAGVDYNLWLGPAPERPFNSNRFHYNWHWNWDYGGGEICNNGIYYLDIARWGLGKTGHPKKVLSLGGRLGYEDDGQTPNTQLAILEYDDVTLLQEIRGLETQPYRDVKMGNVFHGEKGYLASGISGTAAFNPDGTILEKFTGPGDHFRNFADAVKSRKREDLASEVLEGHLSTTLCHLPNVSHKLGEDRPLGDVKDWGGAVGEEALGRLREHLEANTLDPKSTVVRIGKSLTFDGKTEMFPGDDAANALLRREYRKPFVVPDA